MTALPTLELISLAHDHQVWMDGMVAGRQSVHLCESYDEAEALSPYLVDGQDPVFPMLERITESEKEWA